ncbi:hypothetical protein EHW99_1718 [Erwinia amylovora]|uniref:Uncharacterized protein n=3 Tax=Erwinia amylovora TaxID=552 RepID=A0A831A3Q3_ERWAM|nr:hypothetical protein EaACW_1877 [Erwinia amylovora ACW56400]QJQ54422.1 hypothetical protein EHX00_1718 [Erwinia amylovora]CBA20816.1 hypothetical protein predicted by Glimmer/Critica [Erwinia amylovora CFBP1430]CBX80738.1 hypothetical protein predicted by Glimmer/Critica [Erwinia amylovora ATCC BAA-2158]CCO78724.1 hypothetical protein BN432_1926 [Erwinia amylovora Ea356]CCO82518.1 hypothetical protein BN433_1948 [Erwinia amylovora Ea266]CCO86303.1 hypothetical protein BN434_1915 [Erwinia a
MSTALNALLTKTLQELAQRCQRLKGSEASRKSQVMINDKTCG